MRLVPFFPNASSPADKPATGHDTTLGHLDAIRTDLVATNQGIWTFAELDLEEHRSAARLIKPLKAAGFTVKEGVSDMPTAFVASYGSGRPVIGILAEYDALPELSQDVTGKRQPVAGRTAGHGCGHYALGAAAAWRSPAAAASRRRVAWDMRPIIADPVGAGSPHRTLSMVALTGTTDAGHMREDLDVFDFRLDPGEVERIEALAQA